MTGHSKNNNLNYLIDPAFTNVNRLFVLSFARTILGDILGEHFNWWRKFLWLASKNEEENYEKIIEMSNNNNYTTGNLLDFAYLKKKLQINCDWFE